ncbi:hypothetical protein [Longimycelium tulufanense]|nr:hypothetical protein [Longimycelium tulufanense]
MDEHLVDTIRTILMPAVALGITVYGIAVTVRTWRDGCRRDAAALAVLLLAYWALIVPLSLWLLGWW